MKIVIAPDSFKENLTSMEVAAAIEKGIRRVLPKARCIKVPMADGGEGTVQSLVDATGGRLHKCKVKGPMGGDVTARYGLLGDGKTAVIEMAEATFLPQVWEKLPDPADFLANLCYKMGAAPDAWRVKHLDVLVYQVEEFHE